jgi:hypothetical protein
MKIARALAASGPPVIASKPLPIAEAFPEMGSTRVRLPRAALSVPESGQDSALSIAMAFAQICMIEAAMQPEFN